MDKIKLPNRHKTILKTAIPIFLFIGIFLYSFKSKQKMIEVYGHAAFYFIFLLFILWTFQVILYLHHINFSLKPFIRTYWKGIVVSLIMTTIIFSSVPVHLKSLNDETNLLSVAKSMCDHQNAYRIRMGKFFHDSFHIVQKDIPKRPLLFPFAIYVIHTVLGYDYQNVFILNFTIMFLFFAGAYIGARQFTDNQTAIAAIFLLASYPIVSIYGTSGGFELFTCCFFYLSLAIVYIYLKNPDANSFSLLWATLLMLSNTRYESFIFFIIIIGYIFFRKRRFYVKENAFLYSITPILFLPYLWQRFLSVGRYQNPEGVPLFSINAFRENTWIMAKNFLNLDLFLPYNGILNVLTVLFLISLLVFIPTKIKKLKTYQVHFWIIASICILIYMVIVLSHFMGIYDHPSSARLFLLFSIFCALSPVVIKIIRPGWISGRALLFVSFILFLFYHPVASQHQFINSLLTARLHNQEQAFISKLNDPNVLILCAYPSQYVSQDFGAVTFSYANSHATTLINELENQLYSKIIAFQLINPDTNSPISEKQALGPLFQSYPIKQISVLPSVNLRISQILTEGKK